MKKNLYFTVEVPADNAEGGVASVSLEEWWVCVPDVDPSSLVQGGGALSCQQASLGTLWVETLLFFPFVCGASQ